MAEIDPLITALLVVLIAVVALLILVIRYVWVKAMDIKSQYINEDGSVNMPQVELADVMGFAGYLFVKEVFPKVLPTLGNKINEALEGLGKKPGEKK